VPVHISNLSHRPESFPACSTHCKPNGLYWHCISDRWKFCSEYLLWVLLPPSFANSLFNHGLSSLFLYFQCLNERTHMIFKITSLGLLCAAISATPQFRHPMWRPFRARMFIALGLSALFPVLHGVTRFGIRQMNKQIGLFWVIFQGLLYIVGACIYAVSRKGKKTRRHVIQRLISTFSDPSTGAYIPWRVRYLDKLSPNLPFYGCNGYNISPLWINQCL
jgi:uncharacterized membrane protein YidH (DUF202 family)